MENSAHVAPLETKLSLFSFKNTKKQESFRCHMISAYLAMVELVHALHAVWDALLPFALLWWNVMLCATCAKYYSWNRFRFRLQIVGRQFHGAVMGEADAGEIIEKSPLPLHHRKDASHGAVITNYPSGSCAPAWCEQTVEVGSCFLQQSLTSAEDCNMHRNELSTLNPHVDNIVTSPDGHHDDQLSLCEEAPVVSNTHASKALDIASALPTSKLSSLHFNDIRERQQSGLLKAAYWAACPFLLPQQVAPLAAYDPSGYHTIFINCSTVEEGLHVLSGGFASRFALMIGGKEYRNLIRKLAKLHERRACSGDSNILQLALLYLQNVKRMKSIVSFEALEGTSKDLNSEIEEHPSTSNLSSLEPNSDSGQPDDKYDMDASEETERFFGTAHQFYDSMLTSGSQSSLDSSADMEAGNTVPAYCLYEDTTVDSGEDMEFFHDAKLVSGLQSSPDLSTDMEPGDAVLAYGRYEDTMVDNGEDMGVFHENSIELSDNYCDVHNRSASWDFRYDGRHWLQEVDSFYGGYYSAVDGVSGDDNYADDGVLGDENYVDDGLKVVDNAVCGDSRIDEDGMVDENSEAKPLHQSDTWWDEDAVLVGRQEQEEDDALEQAWQVV